MDIKSLYTVIPNNYGLLALTHFLDKRPVLEPPTHTLVRLAELVLTLNSFSFNGGFYQQTGGMAMGSRLGPNYACLFVGHVKEQIFQQYPGRKSDLYKRYIDDIVGAAACTKSELDDFATFVNNFHPSLQLTWAISDKQLPFLDLFLKPTPQGQATTIHYKETDSQSYLTYTSAHPVQCKNSVRYSQFLRLKRICSDENDFHTKSKEMSSFFLHREYPPAVVERALQRVNSISRETREKRDFCPRNKTDIGLNFLEHVTRTNFAELLCAVLIFEPIRGKDQNALSPCFVRKYGARQQLVRLRFFKKKTSARADTMNMTSKFKQETKRPPPDRINSLMELYFRLYYPLRDTTCHRIGTLHYYTNPLMQNYFSHLHAQSSLDMFSTSTFLCKNRQKNPSGATHSCDPVQATNGQLQPFPLPSILIWSSQSFQSPRYLTLSYRLVKVCPSKRNKHMHSI